MDPGAVAVHEDREGLPVPREHPVDRAAGERGLVLSLITARSYGQHNTVVYKERDMYRGMPHRHTILMNAQDLQQAGLQPHQRVTVQGEAGRLEGVEIIPGAIRSGAALMFYPEANVLMHAVCDPQSGTPDFKRMLAYSSVEHMGILSVGAALGGA